MPRPRSFLLDLSLTVIALGSLIAVLATSGSATTSDLLSRQNNVLGIWQEDRLQRIELSRESSSLALVRSEKPTGTKWFFAASERRAADAQAVGDLLAALRFSTWSRRIAPDRVKRDAFGLSTPRRVLSLDMGSVNYRLILGKPAATPEGGAYLELSGDGAPRKGVGVVPKELVQALTADLLRFGGRALIQHPSSDLTSLELSGNGGVRRIKRDPLGFRFSGMLDERRVDLATLNTLLFQLPRLVIDDFLAPAEAKRLLDAASQRVSLTLHAKTAPTLTELTVGGRCPRRPSGRVALRTRPDPLAGCVPKGIMHGLSLPADDLLDYTPFSLTVDGVQRLDVERGDRKLSLLRDGEGFKLLEPKSSRVPLDRGNTRLAELVDARGVFLPDADLQRLGLEPASGTVTLTGIPRDSINEIEERVELGTATSDGRLPLRRASDGAVLFFDREAARPFFVDGVLLRDEQILNLSKEALTWIEIESSSETQELVRNGDALELRRPVGFSVDAVVASSLVDTLAELKAVRWVSDEDDGNFGLDSPRLRLRFRSGDEPARELLVGNETLGGAFASLDHSGVFVLGKQEQSTFSTLLISRQAFQVEFDAVTEVLVYRGAQKLDLVRRGGTFVERSGRVGAAHGEAIVRALTELRAEAAVSTGLPGAAQGLSPALLRFRVKQGADETEISIGARDVHDGASVHYARVGGTNATFVVLQANAHSLLQLL